MELKEKAIELAEHLNDLGIVKFENITMLERHNFEQVVSQILQELQNKYSDTKLKRRMKSVHYANGFTDEELKQSAFMLDDIERYLSINKFMNHDASVRYFNELITTKGFEINPKNLVMTMMDSLLISV